MSSSLNEPVIVLANVSGSTLLNDLSYIGSLNGISEQSEELCIVEGASCSDIFPNQKSIAQYEAVRQIPTKTSEAGRKSAQVDQVADYDLEGTACTHEDQNSSDDWKHTASVSQILENFEQRSKSIKDAKNEMIANHDLFNRENEKIKSSLFALDISKVRGCQFFEDIPKEFIKQFGLIDQFDILPDAIHRYLDFRYNKEICSLQESKDKMKYVKKEIKEKDLAYLQSRSRKIDIKREKLIISLKVVPDAVVFHNYEPGNVYKGVIPVIFFEEKFI